MENSVICAATKIVNVKLLLKVTQIKHMTHTSGHEFSFRVNWSGTRATARTMGIDKDTVTRALKGLESDLWYVNYNYIKEHESDDISIDFVFVDEAEMWSFYHDKKHQIWLWWAIDHNTGEPLAFCFGTREHKNLDALLELLKPFYINIVYSDDNFAYKKRLENNITGKRNTQKIERLHLSLRTWCSRLVRKGIRFSKSDIMHKIVVALVINFWFFGRIIW